MTTTIATTGVTRETHAIPQAITPTPRRIPFARIVGVELRKSFDTRSGLWLLASVGIAALLTTGAVVAWAPEDQLTYSQFTLAIGIPMSVILPIIAVLSVTAEWSQRSGLTTFTLVPHRSRILLAKGTAAVLVAATATVVAFGVGALGNLVGTAASNVPTVWDQNFADVGYFALGNTLLMLVGFTLGALIRNSPGRHRRLHGLRVRRSWTARLPRFQSGLVRRRPSLGRPEVQPGRASPRWPRR